MAEQAKPLDEMVDFVVEEFKRYENFHKPTFERAERIYNAWKGKPPKRDFDWQNAVHKPLMIEGEQTITPRLFSALFPDSAPIDCRVEGETPKEAGVIIKNAIGHYFRVANVQGHMYPTLGQTTLYGTGYAEAGSWLHRNGWIIDSETRERVYTNIEARPDMKFVSFFEMFPNPDKIYMWDGLPLIRRRYVDAETLKMMSENPRFSFKNLAEALKSRPKEQNATIDIVAGNAPRKHYEVLEYWGPWSDIYKEASGKETPRKAVPYWIIIVNRQVKIRAIPNPYNHQSPPFIKTKLFEDVKPNWFGVGIGEVGLSPQDRVNKLINQRLDNVDLVLNKQGLIDANDTQINVRSLQVSKPGKWHKVGDINTSLKPFEFQDVTTSAYQEEKLATDDFHKATGATVPLQPNEKSEQHRTAMGIQLLQGAAGERFKPILRMLELDGIQKIAEFFFSNLHQFMSKEQWIEVAGLKGQDMPIQFLLKPEHLQAKVKFMPTGISETLNKELQIGQLLRYKEITMNDPTVNRMEINKRIAELFGFKELEKLLIQQPPPNMTPGSLPPEMQEHIRQRIAEGASPEQVKGELLGPQPKMAATTGGG